MIIIRVERKRKKKTINYFGFLIDLRTLIKNYTISMHLSRWYRVKKNKMLADQMKLLPVLIAVVVQRHVHILRIMDVRPRWVFGFYFDVFSMRIDFLFPFSFRSIYIIHEQRTKKKNIFYYFIIYPDVFCSNAEKRATASNSCCKNYWCHRTYYISSGLCNIFNILLHPLQRIFVKEEWKENWKQTPQKKTRLISYINRQNTHTHIFTKYQTRAWSTKQIYDLDQKQNENKYNKSELNPVTTKPFFFWVKTRTFWTFWAEFVKTSVHLMFMCYFCPWMISLFYKFTSECKIIVLMIDDNWKKKSNRNAHIIS